MRLTQPLRPRVVFSKTSRLSMLPFEKLSTLDSVSERVVAAGIDLGTTNSTGATIEWIVGDSKAPQARCIEIKQTTSEGDYYHVLLPSIIALTQHGPIIGEGAKRERALGTKYSRNRDLFWECKNDIGLRRTYATAPVGYRSAKEIGGHVLKYLAEAITAEIGMPTDRLVVTVPASFQAAQRRDTLDAARLAGLELVDGDLIDEPVAALLDYLHSTPVEELSDHSGERNILVFDFGGGTCDIAIFGIVKTDTLGLGIHPRSISRYHRLGGGDIDAAIVHEVLLAQIREQNHLSEFELSFEDKRNSIEPAFLAVAEGLKINLSREMRRLKQFNRLDDVDLSTVVVSNPGEHTCKLKSGRIVNLQSPRLSAERLLEVLEPFLDPNILTPQDAAYYQATSIFAPIEDALQRSGLEAGDIHYCLLVGGSSMVPQVAESLGDHFTNAKILEFSDPERYQTAIARGAAYHALSLAISGKGFFHPVAGERIRIRTDDAPVTLIEAGTALPFPANPNRREEYSELRVPLSLAKDRKLLVELLGSEDRLLFQELWTVPENVAPGSRLSLRYRMDANQLLYFELTATDVSNAEPFKKEIENPTTNVVNPSSTRQEIDTIEESIRSNRVPPSQVGPMLLKLADLYQGLNHLDRCLALLRQASQRPGVSRWTVADRLASVCDAMRDFDLADKYFTEAAKHDDDGSAYFNHALSYRRRANYTLALASIERAIDLAQSGPYFTLKATLLDLLKRPAEARAALESAVRLYGSVPLQNNWELGWYLKAAQMLQDPSAIEMAESELRSRKRANAKAEEGALPSRHS